jgi:hypothetical protein
MIGRQGEVAVENELLRLELVFCRQHGSLRHRPTTANCQEATDHIYEIQAHADPQRDE